MPAWNKTIARAEKVFGLLLMVQFRVLTWHMCVQRRTSYFPGLGWMLRREVWLEIGGDFPDQAWDHWMRLNTTSKGSLECLPHHTGAGMCVQQLLRILQFKARSDMHARLREHCKQGQVPRLPWYAHPVCEHDARAPPQC